MRAAHFVAAFAIASLLCTVASSSDNKARRPTTGSSARTYLRPLTSRQKSTASRAANCA